MFSERGENPFAPHGTKAVEHFAQIFFAADGKTNIGLSDREKPVYSTQKKSA
jgi:hypothetical protein